MIVPIADSGNSALVRPHGANDVADPHVPMIWCAICPVVAPSLSVEPVILHVTKKNQTMHLETCGIFI